MQKRENTDTPHMLAQNDYIFTLLYNISLAPYPWIVETEERIDFFLFVLSNCDIARETSRRPHVFRKMANTICAACACNSDIISLPDVIVSISWRCRLTPVVGSIVVSRDLTLIKSKLDFNIANAPTDVRSFLPVIRCVISLCFLAKYISV